MDTHENQTLREAVFTVLEGFTLDHNVRKILESAYYSQDTDAMESISVAKTSLSSLGGYWSTCCPMCESEFHFESPDVDYRKKIPMNEHQKTAILDSRNIAMYNCVKARIPECGEFAKIAQNLDWLCDTLHIEKDDDQRSTY